MNPLKFKPKDTYNFYPHFNNINEFYWINDNLELITITKNNCLIDNNNYCFNYNENIIPLYDIIIDKDCAIERLNVKIKIKLFNFLNNYNKNKLIFNNIKYDIDSYLEFIDLAIKYNFNLVNNYFLLTYFFDNYNDTDLENIYSYLDELEYPDELKKLKCHLYDDVFLDPFNEVTYCV